MDTSKMQGQTQLYHIVLGPVFWEWPHPRVTLPYMKSTKSCKTEKWIIIILIFMI